MLAARYLGGIPLAENQTLTDALARAKIGILPQFNVGIIRGEGKAASQWFAGREFQVDGLTVQLAWFGDWARKGADSFWKSADDSTLTKEAKARIKSEMEAQANEFAEAKRKRHEEKAREAGEMWEKSATQGDHPYIARKKLSSLHGCRIHFIDKHPVILVPMRDVDGKLWNVTRIFTKKFEGTNSDKFVLSGGRKSGLFHLLGEIRDKSTIYFTEGFATGASVYQALGNQPVVICFDAGNLLPVAEAIRAKYPDAAFVFAADNDLGKKDENGVPINTGKEAALKAASVTRGTVVLPRFKDKDLLS